MFTTFISIHPSVKTGLWLSKGFITARNGMGKPCLLPHFQNLCTVKRQLPYFNPRRQTGKKRFPGVILYIPDIIYFLPLSTGSRVGMQRCLSNYLIVAGFTLKTYFNEYLLQKYCLCSLTRTSVLGESRRTSRWQKVLYGGSRSKAGSIATGYQLRVVA